MATPKEKLAQSLEILRSLQGQQEVIKSNDLSRVHRERLLKNGFIREVVKGWYIIVSPNEQEGDSTSWYTSYWHFCAKYLKERFGDTYCLSAEQSLEIHAGNWTVPAQLIIRTSKNITSNTSLPHNTSFFTMKSTLPRETEIIVKQGIRILSLPAAIVHCSPAMFKNHATDMRAVLAMLKDASEILPVLLNGGHSTIAARLAGAFRNNGQPRLANDIVKAMEAADYKIRETDPFNNKPPATFSIQTPSPYINRIQLMWHNMRESVIKHFPQAPGIPANPNQYLKFIDDIYVTDAYHSLSIEKYQVTPTLIERVRSGAWAPEQNTEDQQHRNAMAARGYWQAMQQVKASIEQILNNKNPGSVADEDHSDWYRELFAPSVTAGILKPSDLAGYRNDQVYIGQSKHVPPNKEAVREAMPALFTLLKNEPEASVRAVLGHFVFVWIHPYMDGNGRLARFLMNAMLASGGYPWTVIPLEERSTYMQALEKASVHQEIDDFAKFIAWLVKRGLQGKPVAGLS